MSGSSKQYDVQDVEAWLSSETAYETASETYGRITGMKLSEHHMHEAANAIAQEVGILDVCPSREEIDKKTEDMSKDKFRRPIMMLALDGAHGPMRPEPCSHPRKGKRGGGGWKEIKGFRFYLVDGKNIVHVMSWHQVCEDQRGRAYSRREDTPGNHRRGAHWIWNRWYIKNTNNILKIRCAKYNGTYDIVIGKYKRDDQERIKNKKCKRNLRSVH